MANGTIILNALRRKWSATTRRAPATPRATGGLLDLVLPAGWPASDGLLHWRWRSAEGVVEQGMIKDLTTLPEVVRGAPAQIWTPARETLLTRAQVPTRSPKKIMQALPYVLEDLLLDDPEKLHFAYVRESTGDLIVAVTAKDRVEAWRERLASAGLRILRVLPGHLAVPFSPGAWSGSFMGPELWIRTGFMEGLSCPADVDSPPAVLLRALNEARTKQNAPQQLVIYQPPEQFAVEAWRDALGLPIVIERKPIWDEPDSAPPGLTLLASENTTSLSSLGAPLRPLLPAAVLLSLWFVGSLAFDLTEWWQLRGAHQRVTAEMRDLFQRSFPETKTILDPAKQMQRELERLQRAHGGAGASDLLPLLERVAQVMRGRQDIVIKTLAYRERQLTIDLVAPSSETLDQLKRSFEQGGTSAQLVSTTKRAEGIEAKIRLEQTERVGQAT